MNHADSSIEQTRDDVNSFSLEDGCAPPFASAYEHSRLSVRFNVMHDSAIVHRFLLLENRTYIYKTFIVGDDVRIKTLK